MPKPLKTVKLSPRDSLNAIWEGKISVKCPHCHKKTRVPADASTARCTNCKERFRILSPLEFA